MNKMIDSYGMSVKIKKLSYTVDEDKRITGESYSDTIETKALISPFRGYTESYLPYGYSIEGDYSGYFHSTVDININDRVVLSDNTSSKVNEIIKHFEFNSIAYLEVIMSKISRGE